jgi:hypothetical protein
MNENDGQLLIDFGLKRISLDDFLSRFPVNPINNTGYLLSELECGLRGKNAKSVAYAMLLGFRFKLFDPQAVDILCRLMAEDWHQQHEDIAQLMQRIKDPRCIEVLYGTALKKFEYLVYNESLALARKCTWALADIGTPEAQQAITQLANAGSEAIAGYARKRLDNWQKELHRKGFTP